MNRYQVRVPKNFVVEDVIDEMASKGWDGIVHDLDADKIMVPLKDYRHFQNALFHAVTPYLRNFSLCGMPDFCTDPICMCRLDERPKPSTTLEDHIYHLILDRDLNQFLDDIVEKGFEALDNIVKLGHKDAAVSRLNETFREILAGYLYFNPVCGTTPFCHYAETVAAAIR
jgi:hypothetical protein